MSFPQIRHCLVCENVRPELNGLTTMVGFYGVAPDVTIKIPDFAQPLPALAFLLIGNEGGEGDFELQFRLSDSTANTIVEPPASRVRLPVGSDRLNMGVMVTGLKLPRPGRYSVSLLVNGLVHFQTTFDAEQAGATPQPGQQSVHPLSRPPSGSDQRPI
jgi:hypothetical protein